MPFLLQPWHILLAALCGSVNKRQQQIIEFQNAQIEALQKKVGKKRLLLNDDQRRLLAVKAHAIGRKALLELTTIFTPDTILRWHRKRQSDMKVHLNDGRTVTASAAGWSSEWRLAVMKINEQGPWPAIELSSTKDLRAGEPCLVIGYSPRGDTKFDSSPTARFGFIDRSSPGDRRVKRPHFGGLIGAQNGSTGIAKVLLNLTVPSSGEDAQGG
ncbi:S1 family peptidase [Fuerstiella marisgermanici]|nr:serine protease [Fuerstiella marisgermanici]